MTTDLEFSRRGPVTVDDRMATTPIDRIVHCGHPIAFDSPARRMEESPMANNVKKRR